MLNNLTLEELIAMKLELSSKTLRSPLFGTPIWEHIPQIVQDAVLVFAISTTQTYNEAAAFLGMTPYKLFRLIKKYKIDNYLDLNYKEKFWKRREEKARQKQEYLDGKKNTEQV